MVEIDWEASELSRPPGTYYAEVSDCELKTSRKGDPYFNLRYVQVDGGNQTLCYDIIMLKGGGWGIGKSKLKGLGFGSETSIEASDLIGRRAYLALREDESPTGIARLAVDIAVGDCGMWREDDPPADFEKPTEEETPF